MKKAVLAATVLVVLLGLADLAQAARVVWAGYVPGNGARVGPIRLKTGSTYVIETSGWMYFGRWSKNGRSLYQDSCYEFNAQGRPIPVPVMKNSLGVNLCSNYRSSHVYRSAPFRSDGRGLTFWVFDTDYRDNKGGFSAMVIEVASGGGGTGRHGRSIKIFNQVSRRNSSSFKANRVTMLTVDTKQWDRTPYNITRPFQGRVTIPRGARVYLSSRSNGRSHIEVDNFILITYRSSAGTGGFVIGHHEPVYLNRHRLRKIGPNNFKLNLELTKYLPRGVPLDLRCWALDYGGVGYVSNVYLLIQ